jgi:hypothetical protein
MIVFWHFIPSIVIDVKNLELTQKTIATLKASLTGFGFVCCPFRFSALFGSPILGAWELILGLEGSARKSWVSRFSSA